MHLRLAWFAPVLALAWGLNWPAVKILLTVMPPFTLRWVGLGSAALVLALVALLRGTSLSPPRAAWPGILVGGLLTVAAFNLFVAMAQLNTSTSRAAVLTFTMPMMSVLLAWWLLGERPDRWRAVALALGAAGIAVLAWPVLAPGVRPGGAGLAPGGAVPGVGWLGLLLPLAAALAWSLGTVAAKRWPLAGDSVVNTAWQLVVGALASGVGALLLGEKLPNSLPPTVALALAYHVLVAIAMAYLLWFALLRRVSASVAAMTTLAVPVVGVLGAMALIGERPAVADWFGFGLVLMGAAMVALRLQRT